MMMNHSNNPKKTTTTRTLHNQRLALIKTEKTKHTQKKADKEAPKNGFQVCLTRIHFVFMCVFLLLFVVNLLL